jgi:peptidoglycan/LPS O-acetylase OafA/YrhL
MSKADLVPPNWQTAAALFVVASLIFLVLLATYLRGSSGGLFVRSFALQETWPKLLAPEVSATAALNGLRFLSMAWIVLGHSFLMAGATAGYRNPDLILDPRYGRKAGPFFGILATAQSAVDTFFYLSGYLLVHAMPDMLLAPLKFKKGSVKLLGALLYRYLRLTPALAVVLLCFTQLGFHVGSGPFFPRHQHEITRRCEGSWWIELLYIMNYYPWDSDEVCMGWTWYLGCEMIYFIIGFIIILVYAHSRKGAWALMIALAAVSSAISVYYVVAKRLSLYIFDHQYVEYSYWLYSKPHSRIAPYLIGMATRIVLPPDTKLSPEATRKVSLGAYVSVATLVFITGMTCDVMKEPHHWGVVKNAMHIVLSRGVWGICSATICTACVHGVWPGLNAFLSWGGFSPLARLTYGCYLWHPIVIKVAAAIAEDYYTYSVYLVCSRWLLNCVLSFGLATVLFLLVERPGMTLTAAMMRLRRRPSTFNSPGDNSPGPGLQEMAIQLNPSGASRFSPRNGTS